MRYLVIASFMIFMACDKKTTTQETAKTAALAEALPQTAPVDIPYALTPYAPGGQDYYKGNKDTPKAVLVVFSDFQCPACRSAKERLDIIANQFSNDLLMVFKNYPLDGKCNSNIKRAFHEYACEAAQVARCAGQSGQFWAMHDRIFENQSSLNRENLTRWATELGLSQQLAPCEQNMDIQNKIKEDVALGDSLGVTGTPTVFLNGRKLASSGLEELRSEIKRVMNNGS